MAVAAAQYYFRFPTCWSHLEGQNLSANQTSSTYLNSWLIYNYFRFGKNKLPPYWNSTSGLDFGYITAIDMYRRRTSSKSHHILRKYDVISIFQDGGRGGSILVPVSCSLMSLHSEGQSLSANRFRQHILIHGWDITTSLFEKQTSAMLEFYFRFRSQHFSP